LPDDRAFVVRTHRIPDVFAKERRHLNPKPAGIQLR
jgi:hypothetical protein